MRLRTDTDAAFAETTLQLVIRFIEAPSEQNQLAFDQWANHSSKHLAEVLRVLCLLKSLDALNTLADTPMPGTPDDIEH